MSISESIDGYGSNEDEGIRDSISLEKINHFIEVGFLMDPKNFKHVETYREKTFDSHLVKYLFEF